MTSNVIYVLILHNFFLFLTFISLYLFVHNVNKFLKAELTIFRSSVYFSISALVIVAYNIYTLKYSGVFKNNSFGEGVLVEATGFLFDIFLFGILITLYDIFKDKSNKVQEYENEIDFFRYWHNEKEPVYRITGNIRLLNNEGKSTINLDHCYLHNASLSKADLTSSSMIKTNLSKADLSYANLINANLREANLSEAIIKRAILKNAKLYAANLKGANLFNANLKNASLESAFLNGANFERTDLTSAYLKNAFLQPLSIETPDPKDKTKSKEVIIPTEFKGAILNNANLEKANLYKANFLLAELRNTNLSNTNLREAFLIGSDLRGSNIRGADLRGAKLNSVIVDKMWITKLQVWNVKGYIDIKNQYVIRADSMVKDEFGERYIMLNKDFLKRSLIIKKHIFNYYFQKKT